MLTDGHIRSRGPQRLAALIMVLGMLVASCADGGDDRDEATPTTTADPVDVPLQDTGYGRLMAAQMEGESSEKELALTKFAMAFGPVPGALDIATDGTEPRSGTAALTAVDNIWNELDDEQRTIVEERLEPWFSASFEGADEGPQNLVAPRASAARVDEEEIRRLFGEAETFLEEKLGGDALDYALTFPSVEAADESATTRVVDFVTRFGATTERRHCEIAIGPETRDREVNAVTSAVAHELFHCWSHVNNHGGGPTPGWFEEGVASWVGEEYVGGSSYAENWWKFYFLYNDVALFSIEYPAIGFWSWIDGHSGVDLWTHIPRLHTVATSSSDEELFDVATLTTGIPAESLNGLGASRFRQDSWGSAWTMTGPGIRGRYDMVRAMGIGDVESLEPRPGELSSRSLVVSPPGADALLGVTMSGQGEFRARWDDGTEITTTDAIRERRWCVGAESCECPDGSANPGFEPLPTLGGSPTLAVGAIGAYGTTSRVTVEIRDLCDDDSPACTGVRAGLDCHDDSADVGGATGTWQATPQALNQVAERMFAQFQEDAAAGEQTYAFRGVTGDAFLTFDGGGGVRLDYRDVRISWALDGIEMPAMVISGGGDLQAGPSGLSTTSLTISLTLEGIGDPITITDGDLPSGQTPIAVAGVDGDRLTFVVDLETHFVPHQWDRQG